jgi:molybdate transport system ATP-binding protein
MLLEMDVKLRRGNFVLNSQLELNDINTGLFGKTGAGKSTILGLIAGIIQPQSGRIVLDGKLLFDSRKGIMMPREQRPISAVFQSDITSSTESVQETLTSAFNRTLASRRLKLEFLIEILELESILNCPLIQLSANERKRVTLARALLKSPRLLLLDETFATLGEGYRSQLLPILRRSQDELDLPILYASQSLGDILELTEQLIVMDKGQVLRSGSLGEIAKHSGVLRHLGIRQIDNILPVTITSHDHSAGTTQAQCYGLPLTLRLRAELPVNSQCKISIRANDVALSRSYITGISIQN